MSTPVIHGGGMMKPMPRVMGIVGVVAFAKVGMLGVGVWDWAITPPPMSSGPRRLGG
jgi:hypothetical protein